MADLIINAKTKDSMGILLANYLENHPWYYPKNLLPILRTGPGDEYLDEEFDDAIDEILNEAITKTKKNDIYQLAIDADFNVWIYNVALERDPLMNPLVRTY